VSSIDWTELTGSLVSPNIARGVTSGTSKPNGGGTFTFAMNTLTATPGAYGRRATPQAPNTNFAPLPSGGDMSAAMVRAAGGGTTGFAVFMFLGLTGGAVSDEGYFLGLSDGAPCHIELRKGVLSQGLPDESPGGVNKILRQSAGVVAVDAWVHLRLEMVSNANGDVILNCHQNDLAANPVTAPVWSAISGMASFVDDVAGINTGSAPFTSGHAGFAAVFSDITRRCFVDHLALARQA
jgi:hypothetical protein